MKNKKKNCSKVRKLGGVGSKVIIVVEDKKVEGEITRFGPYPNVTVTVGKEAIEVNPHTLTFVEAPTEM